MTTLTLREYLKEKAKFLSPPTRINYFGPGPPDINRHDVDALGEMWKPTGIRHDSEMVDSLLAVLDGYIRHTPLEPEDTYSCFFQPVVDGRGKKKAWSKNLDEHDARNMVYNGALEALYQVLDGLLLPVTVDHDARPQDSRFSSLVDYVVYRTDAEGKRVLIEVEPPGAMESIVAFLSHAMRAPMHLKLEPGRPIQEKVINKMCISMGSHKACWGAITSHDKWLFLRLHPGEDPYISFSSVENQANNTRPFRALLAMVLAAELDLNVESHTDL